MTEFRHAAQFLNYSHNCLGFHYVNHQPLNRYRGSSGGFDRPVLIFFSTFPVSRALTRVDTGERFTVTTEPAASNGVAQSTLFVWIANDFAFYTLSVSWLSMTNNVSI
jgi:hypothetical protein